MVDRSHSDSPEPILPDLEALIHRQAAERAPVLPELESLVRRRTAKLTRAREPRRRRAAVSAATAAVATCVATAFLLVLPSGQSLASPQETVAAVAKSLDGDGILHWVRRTDPSHRNPAPKTQVSAYTGVEHEWIDLATGDWHRIVDAPDDRRASTINRLWVERGVLWFAVRAPTEGPGPVIMRSAGARPGRRAGTIVDDVRSALSRAEDGTAAVSEAPSEDGTPVVIVTDRRSGWKLRLWITVEDDPRLIRSENTVTDTDRGPEVTTTTTELWDVQPRTAKALRHVRIPSSAVRRG